MVKKIKLIEDEDYADDLDNREFQEKVLEYLQAMDWKLWEMLKIEQARAEKEGLIETESTDEPKVKAKPKSKTSVKSVIVDEE